MNGLTIRVTIAMIFACRSILYGASYLPSKFIKHSPYAVSFAILIKEEKFLHNKL